MITKQKLAEIEDLANSILDSLKITDKWQRELVRRTMELCYHMGARDEARASLDERTARLKRVA